MLGNGITFLLLLLLSLLLLSVFSCSFLFLFNLLVFAFYHSYFGISSFCLSSFHSFLFFISLFYFFLLLLILDFSLEANPWSLVFSCYIISRESGIIKERPGGRDQGRIIFFYLYFYFIFFIFFFFILFLLIPWAFPFTTLSLILMKRKMPFHPSLRDPKDFRRLTLGSGRSRCWLDWNEKRKTLTPGPRP